MSKVYVADFKYDNGASIDRVIAAVKAESEAEAKKIIIEVFVQDADCSVDDFKIREMAEHEVISNAHMLIVSRR